MEIEQRFNTVSEYGIEIQKVYDQIGSIKGDPIEVSRLLDEIRQLQTEQMSLMERTSRRPSTLSIQDLDSELQKINQLLYTDSKLEIYLSDAVPVREDGEFVIFQCPDCQGYGTYTYAYGEELQPHEEDMLLCDKCDGVGELSVKTSNWLAVNQAASTT